MRSNTRASEPGADRVRGRSAGPGRGRGSGEERACPSGEGQGQGRQGERGGRGVGHVCHHEAEAPGSNRPGSSGEARRAAARFAPGRRTWAGAGVRRASGPPTTARTLESGGASRPAAAGARARGGPGGARPRPARGCRRARQEQEGQRASAGPPPAPRSGRGMRFRREQQEGQEGRRHHRGRVAQVVDEVGAEGEGQPAEEGAHRIGAEPAQVEERSDPRRPQGSEHQELEGHEGRQGREGGHGRIEHSGRYPRGGAPPRRGRASRRAARPRKGAPGLGPQRDSAGRCRLPAPSRRSSHQAGACAAAGRTKSRARTRACRTRAGHRPALPGLSGRRSWPEAICSEISPNRNTTTASWMRRAAPMGILPSSRTFQTA